MNRRGFLSGAGAAALGAGFPLREFAQQAEPPLEHRLPQNDADYRRSSPM